MGLAFVLSLSPAPDACLSLQILTRENEKLKSDKVALESEVEDLSRKLLETQTGMQRTLDGTESGMLTGRAGTRRPTE